MVGSYSGGGEGDCGDDENDGENVIILESKLAQQNFFYYCINVIPADSLSSSSLHRLLALTDRNTVIGQDPFLIAAMVSSLARIAPSKALLPFDVN